MLSRVASECQQNATEKHLLSLVTSACKGTEVHALNSRKLKTKQGFQDFPTKENTGEKLKCKVALCLCFAPYRHTSPRVAHPFLGKPKSWVSGRKKEFSGCRPSLPHTERIAFS